jgi:scyllo-inositol 2-dehydrogenase (NADP+)
MKQINAALLSYGMSGQVFHAPFIDIIPGYRLYGVWERSKSLAKEKYSHIKTFRTLESLLADTDIDLVVVNTPSVTHYEYAKACLLAGKHIIVEKPFTATIAQAQELIALAKQKSLLISVFHNRRYDSDFMTVKSIIDANLLGDVIDAEIHYDRYTPMLSYKTHKETPTPAVGCIYDLGSHLIDQSLVLWGMPQSVYAHLAVNRPQSQVDDYIDIKLYYPKHTVTLKSSYYVREPLPAFQIHGTLGSFLKSRADIQEPELQSGKIPLGDNWGKEPEAEAGLLHTEINGEVVKKIIPTLQGNYAAYFQNVLDAIVHGMPLAITGEQGMMVIQIIEAALQSYKERKVIDLT